MVVYYRCHDKMHVYTVILLATYSEQTMQWLEYTIQRHRSQLESSSIATIVDERSVY